MTLWKRNCIKHYLINQCNFQAKTLRLLNDNNLEKLAAEYGFKK